MKSLDIFQTDWEGIEALLKTIGLSLAILLAFYFLANVLQKFLRKRLSNKFMELQEKPTNE
jgi:sorbitol-specific phosphotransferase system component IIC